MPGHIFDIPSVLLLVFSVIATLAVVLRLWARRIQKICLELNDYMILLGLKFALAGAIIFIYKGALVLALSSTGTMEYEKLYSMIAKFNFVTPLLWITAVTLIRFSVILLYIRIFAKRSFRLTCYAILILNTAFFIATFLSNSLSNYPFGCQWSGKVCSSAVAAESIDLPVAIFNLLLDVTVVVLPMPVLWDLQMAVGKKATLSGMFGLGFIICAITAYRVQVTATIDTIVSESPITMNIVLFLFEPILGVITACLPVLKPVFNKVRDSMKIFSGWKSKSKSSKYGSIPIFMRVSQMWESRTRKRSRREGMDSVVSIEDWKDQSSGKPTPKVERLVGTKLFEIRVQRDVHVESSSGEDPISVVV